MNHWQPIATAPKSSRRGIYLARLDSDGTILSLDFNCRWVQTEAPLHDTGVRGYWEGEAGRFLDPNHWAEQSAPPVCPLSSSAGVTVWLENRRISLLSETAPHMQDPRIALEYLAKEALNQLFHEHKVAQPEQARDPFWCAARDLIRFCGVRSPIELAGRLGVGFNRAERLFYATKNAEDEWN